MHRVLEHELEPTNNVYADHAIDTGKQISSADSSNLPPDSSDSSAIGPSNRISKSVCITLLISMPSLAAARQLSIG